LAVDHKGLDILLEGFARCRQGGLASEIELLVAGPDFRSGQAELEAMAASLTPVDSVRFLGPVFGDEKDALLATAYVFAHTSRWEGMPYAVLEALASGCPVLLTHATNLGGFVEDFDAGIMVDETAEGVADGLRRVLEMPPERYAAMCRAARRLASERFNWVVVAEQMSAAYRRILR
jgi:glycosyltransferase involved in cell wall biosynthesis